MPTQIPSSSPTLHLLRVLIVDDMPQVRQDLRLLLELSGAVEIVGAAVDGIEAIRQAEQLRPDVVVMDLEMPGMDGLAATREIKTRGWANRIVILSVHADAADVQRARDAGADVFVDKAAHFEDLLSAIVATRQSNKPKEADV